MIIGKLRDRVTIQQKTITRRTDGSNAISYSGNITVWAQVKDMGTSVIESGNKDTERGVLEVIVRRNLLTDAITNESRLVFNDDEYIVESVMNDERKIYKTIKVVQTK